MQFSAPAIMGILNLTPDSFSDGGQLSSIDAVLRRAWELVEEGAEILDLGGESTRPGAEPVDAETETRRVLPVLRALVKAQMPALFSIDTYKASVAQAALESGAHIINDVSALADPTMAPIIARAGASVIVMHRRPESETVYDDLLKEVTTHLQRAAEKAELAGIAREQIMVDPGLGFGKTTEHNVALTKHLPQIVQLGYPVVYGPSRKRFLGAITGRDVADRDRATAAACALAVFQGARVLRVHNVKEVRDAVRVAQAVRSAL